MGPVGDRRIGLQMRPRWSEALWRYLRAPRLTAQRERQADVIDAIKQQLVDITSPADLCIHYQTSLSLCQQVADALYPDDPFLADLHRTRDVAYGLRYVELVTGRPLSAFDSLPAWLGEWAVLR
ncbi:MAG: hypothetical protein HYY04_17310 [Chloroflexi bacterium]|nr:hypothetical protein [Chloroflexota bacterium]